MRKIIKRAFKSLLSLPVTPTDGITPNDIFYGYRLFLDRNPESQRVIDDKLKILGSTKEIRQNFINSQEFNQNNQDFIRLRLSGDEPPMYIEEVTDLRGLFFHIQKVWEHLGDTEPHWSVITSDKYKTSQIQNTRSEFYNSGRSDAETLFKTLERNGIDHSAFKTCLEYGCGLGRITLWLAKRFEKVTAYDISRSHLSLASEYFDETGIRNVTFKHVGSPEEISNFPKVDVVFSLIVLQHNPPPIIRVIIQELMRALNPGGIAYFQVPTYRLGYKFFLQEYLAGQATKDDMEMHVLPQNEVFRIIHQELGRIVEVFEDGCIGLRHGERSNIFVVQKVL